MPTVDIEYNGGTIATLDEGQTATLDCEGKKMATNVVVKAGAGTSAVPTSVDMGDFDSGRIVETFADGTTKTTTIEFDENGNPVKITDGDGNVTTYIW